jgi:hypothetical protein
VKARLQEAQTYSILAGIAQVWVFLSFSFSLKKQISEKLTRANKEAISDGLARLFYDFWQNNNVVSTNPLISRDGKAIAIGSGFSSEDFPDNQRQ